MKKLITMLTVLIIGLMGCSNPVSTVVTPTYSLTGEHLSTEYSDEELMTYAITFAEIVTNYKVFDNTNSDILTCDQILSYYHNFSPPARSSGCEEIVREYLVRGWIECRDYPPTEGQPYDSASGFEYGRNWQVILGWDGQGSPSNTHSWFLMAYADLTKNNVYMG
ncbi:hypothetical protein LCGC14_2295250, partial [marine sediment metagenome]